MFTTLLVEDNAQFRSDLSTILCESFVDIDVIEADDYKQAACYLKTQFFDLILLDIRLPEGNGLNLIPHIRASGSKDVTIVVLSNNDLPEYRQCALESGADAYISKCSNCVGDIIGQVELTMHASKNTH